MDMIISAVGYSIDNGRSKRAACGITLQTTTKYREIGHPLGAITGKQADLHAAIAALSACKPEYRKHPTVLNITEYASRAIASNPDGSYKTVPPTNIQLVRRLREITKTYPKLTIVITELERPLTIAREHAADQTTFDTGTITS